MLWSYVYKGDDIDSFKILSETSNTFKTPTMYKIVRIKDNTEIDARGRLSAGQKMLASIIIRLALAQSFSSSFNLLALDEPTSNLDEKNIDGLAEALSKIVEARKNSQLQLIIITHDKRFVDKMNEFGLTGN